MSTLYTAQATVAREKSGQEENVARRDGTANFSVLLDWSGTGQGFHVDFDVAGKGPFLESESVQNSHFTTLMTYEIDHFSKRLIPPPLSDDCWYTSLEVVKGIKVIRKSARFPPAKQKIKDNAETRILKELSHEHIIKLLGTYTHGCEFGYITHPALRCTLRDFFEEVENFCSNPESSTRSKATLGALGYFQTESSQHRATPAYSRIGCILSALAYLHKSGLKRKTLLQCISKKPVTNHRFLTHR
jgi:serine/threonine protein kinase